MVDSYTKVTHTSFGSRIMNSIKWVFIWILLFIVSFFVLYINEWTVDLSKIAKTSVEISPDKVDENTDGSLVSLTWEMKTEEKLGDNLFLKSWEYIAVDRKVEMYSWEERQEDKTEDNLWWSQTTTTTYKYNKVWTEYPDDSSSFEIQEWHRNPDKTIDSDVFTVQNTSIWAYNINTNGLKLPYTSNISLNEDVVELKETYWLKPRLESRYVYVWKWDINNPQVWDLRISYDMLPNNVMLTMMWKQQLWSIVQYADKDWNKLFRAFSWTRNDAISTLRSEYLMKLWWFRILWFVLMWAWLSMLFWPLSAVLYVLPVAWSISRFIVWLITFVIALILSSITIIIWMIFHNVYALIITLIIAVVLIVIYFKKKANPSSWNISSQKTSPKVAQVKVENKAKDEKKPNNDWTVSFDIQ